MGGLFLCLFGLGIVVGWVCYWRCFVFGVRPCGVDLFCGWLFVVLLGLFVAVSYWCWVLVLFWLGLFGWVGLLLGLWVGGWIFEVVSGLDLVVCVVWFFEVVGVCVLVFGCLLFWCLCLVVCVLMFVVVVWFGVACWVWWLVWVLLE